MRIRVLAPALSEFRLHPMNESSVTEAKMISNRHAARSKIGGIARITHLFIKSSLTKARENFRNTVFNVDPGQARDV
jgi:hypothetical protein